MADGDSLSPLGIDAAQRALERNQSPRFVEIDNLDRYVKGTAYDGRPDWFNAQNVPLWERKPCIIYPLVKTAIQSNTDLVMGAGRFPAITSNPGENDTNIGPLGLGEEDSAILDRFVKELCRRVEFTQVCRAAFQAAQACRSACAIVGFRNGKLRIDNYKAQWCEPEFHDDGTVAALEIRYCYFETKKESDGKWRTKTKIYRRRVDDALDTTFFPAEAREDGIEPIWRPNPALTFAHGMGFCPVHWYAHMKECSETNEYDGFAIHETCLGQVFGHDLALSMRHRSAVTLGDPQPYETGVDPGYNPTGQNVRSARVPATKAGGVPTPNAGGVNPVTGSYVSAQTIFAKPRPKGPTYWYQYPNENAKVGYLTLPHEGLGAISEHARDLRLKACESLGVVFLDAEHIKFAAVLSGKALAILRERQLSRCDLFREDFGNGYMLPVLSTLLRLVLKFDVRGIPGSVEARQILKPFWDESLNEWTAPVLVLKWPDYFKPDPEEEMQSVEATTKAMAAGACGRRQAVEKLRRVFPVESVDQALDNIDGDPGRIADNMAKAALGGLVESELYRREISKRFMRAMLVGAEPEILKAMDSEVDAAEVKELLPEGTPGGEPKPASGTGNDNAKKENSNAAE